MAKCNKCDAKIMWVELDTGRKVVTVAIDPAPFPGGDITVLGGGNPDAPAPARKATSKDAWRYRAHRQTCPEQETYRPSGNRTPHFDENGRPYFDE